MSVISQSWYRCSNCLQYFSTWEQLIRHVFSHELCVNTPLHICPFCGQVFLNLPKLCAHYYQENKKTTFKEPSLMELCCAFCADSFLSWSSLVKHVFSHTSAISAPFYVCTFCSKIFEDMAQLDFHKYTTKTSQQRRSCDCKSSIYTLEQQLYTAELENNSVREVPVTTYSWRNSHKHKQHQTRRPLVELSTVGKFRETSRMGSWCHQKMYMSYALFSRETCKKIFMRFKNLHVGDIYLGTPQFSCEVCGKYFKQSGLLKEHKKIHSLEKVLSCVICGDSFTLSDIFKRHQSINSNKRSFSCEVCGKHCKHAGDLKKHQRSHSGERPFSCEVCGKSFSQSGNLKVHQRIHSVERTYSCDVCGKSFKQSVKLKVHKKTHCKKTFSCVICGLVFTRSDNCKRHQNRHLDKRSFSCEVCGRSFTRHGYLKAHKKVHSDETLV